MEKPSKQRVFLGIDPVDWKKSIAQWLVSFQNETAPLSNDVFSFREISSLHLTLLFLGELDKTSVEILHTRLSQHLVLEKINLVPKKIGLLHSHVVIFCEMDNLKKLHEQLKTFVHESAIHYHDAHRFLPHITLGKVINKDKQDEVISQLDELRIKKLQSCVVKEVNMYQSYPQHQYVVLHQYD